jgi:hypothetical protein
VTRPLALLAVAAAALLLAGCGKADPPAQDEVGAHVGAAKTPQGKAAESAYLAALRGAGVPITAQSTIDGYSVCVVLNQGTTADDAATEAKQTFDLPADEAAKLVAAAQATLCQLAGKPR